MCHSQVVDASSFGIDLAPRLQAEVEKMRTPWLKMFWGWIKTLTGEK